MELIVFLTRVAWRSAASMSRRLRLAHWKLHRALLPRPDPRDCGQVTAAIGALENRRSNSGAFPIDPVAWDPASITATITDRRTRRTCTPGFEGLALDDALVFLDEYKNLSYVRLAKAIASIGRARFGTGRWSVLELGCGGGDLFSFLWTLGVREYLGVDGNPVALAHSPYVRGRETHFRSLNLHEGIDFGRTFDLVCSFEVLEHIAEDRLDGILDTIRTHMAPRSIFLGTASLAEDHDVHVTVRPRKFWLERFRAHGLVPLSDHAQWERHLAKNHPFNWTPDTTNVFALGVR